MPDGAGSEGDADAADAVAVAVADAVADAEVADGAAVEVRPGTAWEVADSWRATTCPAGRLECHWVG